MCVYIYIYIYVYINNKEISEQNYNDLYPVSSFLYSLVKIHKPIKDDVPSFRPILSALEHSLTKSQNFCAYFGTYNSQLIHCQGSTFFY